ADLWINMLAEVADKHKDRGGDPTEYAQEWAITWGVGSELVDILASFNGDKPENVKHDIVEMIEQQVAERREIRQVAEDLNTWINKMTAVVRVRDQLTPGNYRRAWNSAWKSDESILDKFIIRTGLT